MGNGYCGPDPRAGNGDGHDGLCTGHEARPPCGPGVEQGHWYPYTLAISCDAHTIFNGRRWLSTLGPPPAEETKFLYRHAFRTLGEGPDRRVVIFRHGMRLSEPWREDLTPPLPESEWRHRWEQLEVEWEEVTARAPTFTVMSPYPATDGRPLTLPLPPAEAVAAWSEIVADEPRSPQP